MEQLLRQLTPLSICDSKEFSPDVAVGLEPVLQLFRGMAEIGNPEYKVRNVIHACVLSIIICNDC